MDITKKWRRMDAHYQYKVTTLKVQRSTAIRPSGLGTDTRKEAKTSLLRSLSFYLERKEWLHRVQPVKLV